MRVERRARGMEGTGGGSGRVEWGGEPGRHCGGVGGRMRGRGRGRGRQREREDVREREREREREMESGAMITMF